MSRSWGHALMPLPDDERFRYADERLTCSTCRLADKKPAEWLATYNYVTGRAGRVSWARRYLCDDHALKFWHKWLPLAPGSVSPADVPVSLHTKEQNDGR